jgi:starch synthase
VLEGSPWNKVMHVACVRVLNGTERCASFQVVMLGSGHPSLEQALKAAEREHPDFFRGIVQFSEPLAHQIMAAADILLMPSRFEPCGLNQMHAMRYGTVPVVHATGGLQDTVLDVTPFSQGAAANGTGWTFSPASDAELIAAVKDAVHVYRSKPERWRNIQLAGMLSDWGWGRAAQSYEAVVRATLAPVK